MKLASRNLACALVLWAIFLAAGQVAYARVQWNDKSLVDKWAWAEIMEEKRYTAGSPAGPRTVVDFRLNLYTCNGDFVCEAWVEDLYYDVRWNFHDVGDIVNHPLHQMYVLEHCQDGYDRIKDNQGRRRKGVGRNDGSPGANSSSSSGRRSVRSQSSGSSRSVSSLSHYSKRRIPSGGINFGISSISGSDLAWEPGGISAGLRLAKVLGKDRAYAVFPFIALDASYEYYKGAESNDYISVAFYNLDPVIGITTSREKPVYFNILEFSFPIPGLSVAELDNGAEKTTKTGAQFGFGTSIGISLTTKSALVLGIQYKANMALENFEDTNRDYGSGRFAMYGRLAFF